VLDGNVARLGASIGCNVWSRSTAGAVDRTAALEQRLGIIALATVSE
jgi:hypothetical protein